MSTSDSLQEYLEQQKIELSMSILFSLSLLVLVAAIPVSDELEEWNDFKVKHGKNYNSKSEEAKRLEIFLNHKKLVENHNKMHANGLKSFKMGLNKFADLTNFEFRKMMNGYKRQLGTSNGSLYEPPIHIRLPASVNWRQKGAVTPVKNQAQCGSCWAFSTTGSLEGQHFLKTGKLVSLSEQNLVDCSYKQGNEGCDGGWIDKGFAYVEANGIDTEDSYPYTSKDGTCKFKKASVGATCTGFKDISSGDENALQSAVATVGPVSVTIGAGQYSFQFYESGVYYENSCDPESLDHCVLAVGYGSEYGEDYWLVKNSWGEDWGISGYIKMSRNRKNNCGIATEASYPLV